MFQAKSYQSTLQSERSVSASSGLSEDGLIQASAFSSKPTTQKPGEERTQPLLPLPSVSRQPTQPKQSVPPDSQGSWTSRAFANSSAWAVSSLSALVNRKKSAQPEKMSVSDIKLRFELCLQDVEGHDVQRARMRIRACRAALDLWYLRSDVHSIVSRRHSQSEAAKRINELMPCFEGWLPARYLVTI